MYIEQRQAWARVPWPTTLTAVLVARLVEAGRQQAPAAIAAGVSAAGMAKPAPAEQLAQLERRSAVQRDVSQVAPVFPVPAVALPVALQDVATTEAAVETAGRVLASVAALAVAMRALRHRVAAVTQHGVAAAAVAATLLWVVRLEQQPVVVGAAVAAPLDRPEVPSLAPMTGAELLLVWLAGRHEVVTLPVAAVVAVAAALRLVWARSPALMTAEALEAIAGWTAVDAAG